MEKMEKKEKDRKDKEDVRRLLFNACPRCTKGAVDMSGDYPRCVVCGHEVYSLPLRKSALVDTREGVRGVRVGKLVS